MQRIVKFLEDDAGNISLEISTDTDPPDLPPLTIVMDKVTDVEPIPEPLRLPTVANYITEATKLKPIEWPDLLARVYKETGDYQLVSDVIRGLDMYVNTGQAFPTDGS